LLNTQRIEVVPHFEFVGRVVFASGVSGHRHCILRLLGSPTASATIFLSKSS
jgi:hypothetical protein